MYFPQTRGRESVATRGTRGIFYPARAGATAVAAYGTSRRAWCGPTTKAAVAARITTMSSAGSARSPWGPYGPVHGWSRVLKFRSSGLRLRDARGT